MFYAGPPKSVMTPEIPLHISSNELVGPADKFPVCVDDAKARESVNKVNLLLRNQWSEWPQALTTGSDGYREMMSLEWVS